MTRDERVRGLAIVLAALDDLQESWRAPRYMRLAAEVIDRLDGRLTVIDVRNAPRPLTDNLHAFDRVLAALFGLQPRRLRVVKGTWR
jgi:hypothetical protein